MLLYRKRSLVLFSIYSTVILISSYLLSSGHLECAILPCKANGEQLPEDDFVDEPEELVSFVGDRGIFYMKQRN